MMQPVKRFGLMVLQTLFFIVGDYVHGGDANNQLNVTCSEYERNALLDFKTGIEDPQNQLESWKGSNCCQWWGIGCNKAGAVITVDLQNRYDFYNLSGEIRPSLTKLESLRYLDLSFNTFKGISVPKWFGSLKHLRYLNLSNAGFSGSFPSSIGNLSRLEYLDIECSYIDLLEYSFGLYVDNLEWITGLVSLKHLVMNRVDLSMVGLDWIKILNNLPSLTELHMSSCNLIGPIPSISFVNSTSSLAVIVLSENSFINSKLLDWLANISTLVTVDVSYAGLSGNIPLGFSQLPNMETLRLGWNHNLTANCSQFFEGRWESIQILDLAYNKLYGKIPASIGNMSSLTYLDLSYNNVQGGIPSSIGMLCNLESCDISNNNLSESLSNYLEGTHSTCHTKGPLPSLKYLHLSNNELVGMLPEWLGQLRNLVELNLGYNLLHGPIPKSLWSLQNLTDLKLDGNKLNGTLPNSLGQLSKLSTFDVSFNQLSGVITETHFLKLHKLKYVHLSSNYFTMAFNSNWTPPFQAKYLFLGSCRLGPSFPTWLRSQKEVNFLDLSNSSISGSIPDWLWEISSNLILLNVSFNQLKGHLPNPFNIALSIVDLSSNQFEGPIPIPNGNTELLVLSNNKFSGPIPNDIGDSQPNLRLLSLSTNQIDGPIPNSIGKMHSLGVIDLSNNKLVGKIPLTFGNFSNLKALDLSKNSLSGTIPHNLGQLSSLQTLHLSDNKLSGSIPPSFQNLSSLETLDLGNNRLAGYIPHWLGNGLENLRILKLRSNAFFGELPSLLSNLSSLQVLDLADNGFNGSIPTSYGCFKAMFRVQRENRYLFYGNSLYDTYYKDSLVLNVKGQEQKYTKTLSLVVSLDLSANNLSGILHSDLTNLLGLEILNLSKNHISGFIPPIISKLQQLSSLDLSNNRLSGTVPNSLSSLSFLGHLNLSNNNFSGKIPYNGHMTTFEASSFAGNQGLCGKPLDVKCPSDNDTDFDKEPTLKNHNDDDDGSFLDNWFYVSVGLGFATGLLVPFFMLAMKKSWSESYFGFVETVVERIPFFEHKIRSAIHKWSKGLHH
ncbi:hypothetical protein CsatB_018695 [Cannabis sativa]